MDCIHLAQDREEVGVYCIMRSLYPLPSIMRMTKSRIMRWAGHVAGMEVEEYI
jgi:hypothetical protein